MERAFIVTDLGFGDAGKGTTVDFLARQAESTVVVRHSGGAQAAHNVVTPDGRHHTFSQFGSGSFVEGVRTHLSSFMLVSPSMMLAEADHLIDRGVPDIWERLTIDRDAPLILPWHQAATRLRELSRGDGRHGSTGVGIAEVQRDILDDPTAIVRAGDVRDLDLLLDKLRDRQQAIAGKMRQLNIPDSPAAREAWTTLTDTEIPLLITDQYRYWSQQGFQIVEADRLTQLAETHQQLVFEGSQGVLLDEWFGFHPYTTWSTTTSENAETLLDELGLDTDVTRLGILRAYTTRHGPGPFVTEDPALTTLVPELHNDQVEWTGTFRYGYLDLVAHRYAVDVTGGVDQLVMTGFDRLPSWQVATAYQAPMSIHSDQLRLQDGLITGLTPGIKDDLDRQELLTNDLLNCSPHYHSPDPVDAETLIGLTESALGVPVTIASYGPTMSDKRVLALV